MSFCGSVCDWVDDNVIDPVEEFADDATDWVDDNIVDPIEDLTESTWDFIEEQWPYVQLSAGVSQGGQTAKFEIHTKIAADRAHHWRRGFGRIYLGVSRRTEQKTHR